MGKSHITPVQVFMDEFATAAKGSPPGDQVFAVALATEMLVGAFKDETYDQTIARLQKDGMFHMAGQPVLPAGVVNNPELKNQLTAMHAAAVSFKGQFTADYDGQTISTGTGYEMAAHILGEAFKGMPRGHSRVSVSEFISQPSVDAANPTEYIETAQNLAAMVGEIALTIRDNRAEILTKRQQRAVDPKAAPILVMQEAMQRVHSTIERNRAINQAGRDAAKKARDGARDGANEARQTRNADFAKN